MKIIVVNAMVPFAWGGAEHLAHHLVVNLRRSGHDADLFNIPFQRDPYHDIPVEMARLKALRMPQADQVISLKFPIYLLDADNHTTWLIHQYREVYDLWSSPYCNVPRTADGLKIRDMIIATDNEVLGSRERLFTISNEVSSRLIEYNGIKAPALRLPLNDPELFQGGEYENYILASGRVSVIKRQWLLIEAMRHADPRTRLVVVGPPDNDAERDKLHRLVDDYGLGDRVKLDLRFLSREELAAYVNNCRAVAYLPFQEDSYGYVTMEAFEAGKPVIAASDCGGVLDIVLDGQTGRVTAAEPEELAKAMSFYANNEAVAREHGLAARTFWRSTGINWSDTVARLVGG
jgi:glycosyltransferase involved in cell wall biosynthesis